MFNSNSLFFCDIFVDLTNNYNFFICPFFNNVFLFENYFFTGNKFFSIVFIISYVDQLFFIFDNLYVLNLDYYFIDKLYIILDLQLNKEFISIIYLILGFSYKIISGVFSIWWYIFSYFHIYILFILFMLFAILFKYLFEYLLNILNLFIWFLSFCLGSILYIKYIKQYIYNIFIYIYLIFFRNYWVVYLEWEHQYIFKNKLLINVYLPQLKFILLISIVVVL